MAQLNGENSNSNWRAQLSPDHSRLYIPYQPASFENAAYAFQCYSIADGEIAWTTEPMQDAGVISMAISPSGDFLVTSSGYEDPRMHVWDAETGKYLRNLAGHTGYVSQMMFANDGKLLVSANTDQTIRVWDTETWEPLKTYRGHTSEVQGVAVSSTSQLIASADKDGKVALWKLQETDKSTRYRQFLGEAFKSSDSTRSFGVVPLGHTRFLRWEYGKPAYIFDASQDFPPIQLEKPASSDQL